MGETHPSDTSAGVADSQIISGPATLNGTLVDSGIAQLGLSNNLVVYGDYPATVSFTATGTDKFGAPLVETFSSVSSKAFTTVASVEASESTVNPVTVGTVQDVFLYNYFRVPADVTSDMTATPDMARLWIDALEDELAVRLYQKFGSTTKTNPNTGQVTQTIDPGFYKLLRGNAAESFYAAQGSDRQWADTTITVKYGR